MPLRRTTDLVTASPVIPLSPPTAPAPVAGCLSRLAPFGLLATRRPTPLHPSLMCSPCLQPSSPQLQAPLVALGYRTRLDPEHLIPDPSVSTQRLYGNLEPAWQEEQRRGRPDLKRALLHGNVRTLLLTGALYLVAQACSLAGPLLLRQIVSGLQCAAAQRKQPAADVTCRPRDELYL